MVPLIQLFGKWTRCKRHLGFDAGCGSGSHAIEQFLPKGYQVHFFDCSKQVLDRLRSKLKEKGIPDDKYKITRGNIEDIQTVGDQYKVIFADAVLFHVGKDQVPEILNRFHRMLVDDGFLFANFKVNDHTLIGIDGRLFEYYSDHWDIQRMLENAGFRVEDVTMTQKLESMYGSHYPTHWAHFICSKGKID